MGPCYNLLLGTLPHSCYNSGMMMPYRPAVAVVPPPPPPPRPATLPQAKAGRNALKDEVILVSAGTPPCCLSSLSK